MFGGRYVQLSLVVSEHIFYILSLKLKPASAGPFLPCFWAEIDSMNTSNFKIEILINLANECEKYSVYRALGSAAGRFEPCVRMWQARWKLWEL